MARAPTWPGLKRHRNYTFDEAALATGKHKNTIASWVKRGELPAITEKRPYLVRGCDLIDYLHAKRKNRRVKLKAGEMYCLGCKAARRPAAGMVDRRPTISGAANFEALCAVCDSLMYRRVAEANVDTFLRAVARAASGR